MGEEPAKESAGASAGREGAPRRARTDAGARSRRARRPASRRTGRLAAAFLSVHLAACLALGCYLYVRGRARLEERTAVRAFDSWDIGVPAGAPARGDAERIIELARKLRPLHRKLAPPGPRDWLAQHDEPGQTFVQYVSCDPTLPRGGRSVIYIQPVGDFTETQRRIVELTAGFMGTYFSRPVKVLDDVPLSVIPERARRVHPSWGDRQILTTYVLDELLRPRLPGDAAACLALTASDLWPGPGWNFVFGQASLRERVGVWSIYRNGDPDASDPPAGGEAAFRLCLLRTLKTATHETGHMFSMLHCTRYECNMCGSNHREESDRRPLALCPECVAKVAWATGADLAERYRKLAEFARAQGLEAEADFYEASAARLASD